MACRSPTLLILPIIGSLVACAQRGPFPSLEPRAAERLYAEGDEERKPVAAPDDAATVAEAARLVAEARRGGSEFDSALPAAQGAAARAGAAGSDSWMVAQQAISRVEAARRRTTAALADLDAYALERTGSGTLSPGDGERLRSALAEVQALADGQAARLDRLEASLRRR
jgi:hypothetical protein